MSLFQFGFKNKENVIHKENINTKGNSTKGNTSMHSTKGSSSVSTKKTLSLHTKTDATKSITTTYSSSIIVSNCGNGVVYGNGNVFGDGVVFNDINVNSNQCSGVISNVFDLTNDHNENDDEEDDDDDEEDDSDDDDDDSDDDDYDSDDDSEVPISKRPSLNSQRISEQPRPLQPQQSQTSSLAQRPASQPTYQSHQPTYQSHQPTYQSHQPIHQTQLSSSTAYSSIQSKPALAASHEDDADEDEWEAMGKNVKNWNCNKIRQKISEFLATKEMTQTKFLSEIGGVNSNSFQRFMKLRGPYTGSDNGTYSGSIRFFNMREKAEKVAKASLTTAEKKRKREEAGAKKSSNKAAVSNILTLISGISLPPIDRNLPVQSSFMQYGDFPVYDTCDDVRKKALEFIQLQGETTTSFLRMIDVNSKSWKSFMEFRGSNSMSLYCQKGAGNSAYPKAYAFFEKLRIARNEPKTQKRIKFEAENPNGYSLKHENEKSFLWR